MNCILCCCCVHCTTSSDNFSLERLHIQSINYPSSVLLLCVVRSTFNKFWFSNSLHTAALAVFCVSVVFSRRSERLLLQCNCMVRCNSGFEPRQMTLSPIYYFEIELEERKFPPKDFHCARLRAFIVHGMISFSLSLSLFDWILIETRTLFFYRIDGSKKRIWKKKFTIDDIERETEKNVSYGVSAVWIETLKVEFFFHIEVEARKQPIERFCHDNHGLTDRMYI